MREIDRLTVERFALPSLILMETAAAAATRIIVSRLLKPVGESRIAVFCGPGNNGGDGAALARQLALQNAQVDVLLCGKLETVKGDAKTNFELLQKLAAPQDGLQNLSFQECPDEAALSAFVAHRVDDVLVDAMFGTGLTRPLTGVYEGVINYLADTRRARQSNFPLIVSLDLPSGLNADAAELIGPTVKADLTITMTAPKLANVLPPAQTNNGALEIAHLGSPQSLLDAAPSSLFLIEQSDAQQWLADTRYTPDSYKNSHGHALVVAGSRNFTGASVLTANAAMRSGAGLVTLAAPASILPFVVPRLMPEVMALPLKETAQGAVAVEALETTLAAAGRATVIALGPGLSAADESTRHFVRQLVEQRSQPVVIDADGLNALAPWPAELRGTPEAPLVLTPHLGEMRRLMGLDGDAVLVERHNVAREFAAQHNVHLVLKGPRIVIGAPAKQALVNPTGNAGAGTAGAGDTLTGIITGFLAQSFDARRPETALEAIAAAAYVSGAACDHAAQRIGMRAMTASDIREHLTDAFRALDPKGEQP